MAIGEKKTKEAHQKATAAGAAEATEEQISKEKKWSLEEEEETERESRRPYRSMKIDGAMDANAEEEPTAVEKEEAVEQSLEEMRSQSDKTDSARNANAMEERIAAAAAAAAEQNPEEMRSQSDKTYCAMDANGDDEHAVEEEEMKQSTELESLKASTGKWRKLIIQTSDGMCFPYEEYMSRESILFDDVVNACVEQPASQYSDRVMTPLPDIVTIPLPEVSGATFAIMNNYWEKRTSFKDEKERMQWEIAFASSLAEDRDALANVLNLASCLSCQDLVTLLCEETAHKAEKMTLEQMQEYFYPEGKLL